MKVKAISGKMIIGFGGPTAYFGNSDVFLRPICVDAATAGPEWRTVEFSLHYGLLRNFRRASFGATAPGIYYARWAQEPTYCYIFKGSGGEIQVKDVEIVAHDIAKPFPVFGADDTTPVATLADFQSADATGKIFTALIGETDKEFDLSWNQQKPIQHPPAEIQITNDSTAGRILHTRGLFLEEVSAVGVILAGTRSGDGLRFRVKADTAAVNWMIPAVQCQPLDFLLYESTAPATFDWRQFRPSPELRQGPGKGYDCNLTCTKLKSVANLSLAIYHARRFVPKGEWSELTIPVADFLCIYGSGDLTDRFQGQCPPDPRRLVAAVVLAPWPRQGRSETSIDIRDVSLVKFKQADGNRRSYFQFPDPASLKSVKSRQGGYSCLLSPGETNLPPVIKKLLDDLD